MLSLETDGAPDGVGLAPFPDIVGSLAREEVSRIELHTGFRRVHLHDAARDGVGEACGEAQLPRRLVEHVVVVVARAELQLLVAVVDPGPDPRGTDEVHRRPLDGAQHPWGST